MPAMHDSVKDHMVTRLEHYKERMLKLIPFDLTHQECLELVAPPEHIAVLTDAAKYAAVASNEAWMCIHVPQEVDGHDDLEVALWMRTHGEEPPPLRPRYPQWQPGKKGHKVIEWATKRMELGRRFGIANWTLDKLAKLCDTGAQVRYLWPACMHLVDGSSETERVAAWAEKHAIYKPVRFAPAISPQLKRAIQDSSALLTGAVLMGDDVPEPVSSGVIIDIHEKHSFEYDGHIIWRK